MHTSPRLQELNSIADCIPRHIVRWGWTPTQASDKFEECLADPAIPKSVDEEGFQTVAKYARITLSSSRELKHSKQIEKSDSVEASTNQLGELMQNLGDCANLHMSTNLFDISSVPSLPSLHELSTCNKFMRGRAQAKPKTTAKAKTKAVEDADGASGGEPKDADVVESALLVIKQTESKRKWVPRLFIRMYLIFEVVLVLVVGKWLCFFFERVVCQQQPCFIDNPGRHSQGPHRKGGPSNCGCSRNSRVATVS